MAPLEGRVLLAVDVPPVERMIPLDVDGSATAIGSIGAGEPAQRFRFVAARTARVVARVRPVDDGPEVGRLSLVRGGMLLEATTDRLVVDADAGNSYTLQVAPPNSGGPGRDYVLGIVTDDFGDLPQDATPILLEPASSGAGPGELQSAVGGDIDYGSDRDSFRFAPPGSGVITIRQVASSESGLDSLLTASTLDGPYGLQTLAANDDAGGGVEDSLVRFAVQGGRSYFVDAASARDSTGAYRLTFDFSPKFLGGDFDDFGNTPSAASPVALAPVPAPIHLDSSSTDEPGVASSRGSRAGSSSSPRIRTSSPSWYRVRPA